MEFSRRLLLRSFPDGYCKRYSSRQDDRNARFALCPPHTVQDQSAFPRTMKIHCGKKDRDWETRLACLREQPGCVVQIVCFFEQDELAQPASAAGVVSSW